MPLKSRGRSLGKRDPTGSGALTSQVERVSSSAAPMSRVICECPREQRCGTCFDNAIMCLGGTASVRGDRWAERVARSRPDLLERPWPSHDGRAAELARKHVADLSADPRLIERFAAIASESAARRWRDLEVQRRRDAEEREREREAARLARRERTAAPAIAARSRLPAIRSPRLEPDEDLPEAVRRARLGQLTGRRPR